MAAVRGRGPVGEAHALVERLLEDDTDSGVEVAPVEDVTVEEVRAAAETAAGTSL